MHASVFELEMKSIIEQIKDRSNHQYLNFQISKPEPSYQKIGLLFLYLTSKSYDPVEIRTVCIATGLIQMGLDIHEWVMNDKIHTSTEVEIRQLQVLAGDYFSSQYYQLLSTVEDITSIQMIAQSVRKINEQKVIYYQHQQNLQNDFEQWITHKIAIEAGLFHGIISSNDHEWLKLIQNFIHLDLLQNIDLHPKWEQRFLQLQYFKILSTTKDHLRQFRSSSVFQKLQKMLKHYENESTSSLVAEEI